MDCNFDMTLSISLPPTKIDFSTSLWIAFFLYLDVLREQKTPLAGHGLEILGVCWRLEWSCNSELPGDLGISVLVFGALQVVVVVEPQGGINSEVTNISINCLFMEDEVDSNKV